MDKNEIIRTVQVDPDKIACKTCIFQDTGKPGSHYTKGECLMYPNMKPVGILFNGEKCKFYERFAE